MVFHPYREEEVYDVLPVGVVCEITNIHEELTVLLRKD